MRIFYFYAHALSFLVYIILYFLQKNDIMLHFTLTGSSDVTGFQCLLFVYLESVAGFKFGFNLESVAGFKFGLELNLNWSDF